MQVQNMTLGVIFFLLDFIFTTSANYEYICQQKPLVTPYIKIYDRRHGDLLKDYPPGFYDVSHLQNIYVCTNGPVWMFIQHHTKIKGVANVYDQPRYGVDVHECKFYNGMGGPGTSMKKPDKLKAILLLGDESDYTLPSMKLFTAPLLQTSTTPDSKSQYRNVTSIVLINSHQCKIFKGPEKIELRVDVGLKAKEESLKRICYLPYQNVEGWLKDCLTDPCADDDKKKTLSNALQMLRNEDGMAEGTCFNQNGKLGRSALEIKDGINATKILLEELQKNLTAEFSDAPVDQTDAIKAKKERLKQITETKDWEKDAAVKTEKEEVEKELSKLEAEQKYYQLHTFLKDSNNPFTNYLTEAESKIKAEYDIAKMSQEMVDNATIQLKKIDEKRGKLVEDEAISEDEKDEKYKELRTEFVETKGLLANAQLDLDSNLKTMIPFESQIEVEYLRLLQQVHILRRLKKEAVTPASAIPAAQNRDDILPTRIQIDETKTEKVCVSLPTPGSPHYFAEDDGACNTKRATKLFGCQLLRASMGEPGICSYNASQVDVPFPVADGVGEAKTHPADDPAQELTASVKEFIPAYMLEVLDLINDIYATACDRIRRQFAIRVNKILQCYLVRARTFNNLTVTDLPTKSRIKFWGKIIGALKDCKGHKHKLVFHKESRKSNKYYLYKKKDGGGGEYFEVPFMKEQAENEFGFNFAIDMSWKIFATVLGLCMPSYETKIPLITSRFFTLYTEEFLQPLANSWNSTKDNNVFKRVLSAYYGVGGSEEWASYCMEASYIYSSDISYRPPRKLLVNDGSEYNYFVDKQGNYKPNKKPSTNSYGCTAACKDNK